ncbi:hypothetical protein [Luteimonas sp. R10]|uniref:hypothetical protein n=1 Tax=Luteimonas sp. R10 TaxID=3108176 RepID=UPI00308C7E84|nr:hypothetical protein U3649_01375 [Luteimonas sp. R10]
MKVTISKLSAGSIGFKAASYAKWDPQLFIDTAPNDENWSGLYVAEDEDVAAGYLVDCVAGGNGAAYIHEVDVSCEVPLLVCMDEAFKGGVDGIDMDALRVAVREVGVQIADGPFMPALGALGYFFRCYNNEDGATEIIVPVPLAGEIAMRDYKECTLRNYEASCKRT